jgi:hypothetical protein
MSLVRRFFAAALLFAGLRSPASVSFFFTGFALLLPSFIYLGNR